MNFFTKLYDWWSWTPFPIQDLPYDVFGEFILFLDPIVLSKLMQTCHRLHDHIANHSVWGARYRQVNPLRRYRKENPLRFVPSMKECREEVMKHWTRTQISGVKFWDSDQWYIQFEYDTNMIKYPVEIGGKTNNGNERRIWQRHAWMLRKQPTNHQWIVVDFPSVSGVYFPLVYEGGKLSLHGLYQISCILEK